MKLKHQVVLVATMAASLSACSGSGALTRANDGFAYENTPALTTWHQPEGTAPITSNQYQIPQGNFQGAVGSNLNIAPPVNILSLIMGTQVATDNQGTTVQFPQAQDLNGVWTATTQWLAHKKIAMTQQGADALQTDWLSWDTGDKTQVRYAISRSDNQLYTVNLIGLMRDGSAVAITPALNQRYSAMMINQATMLYQAQVQKMAQAQAAKMMGNVQMYVANGSNGSPVIMAQAPYEGIWARLPTLLQQMGFTVEDLNQAQGNMSVKYSQPKASFWKEIGQSPVTLPNGKYQILIGDMGNSTSINLAKTNGQPVAKSDLETLASAMAALLQHDNQQGKATQ